MKKPSGHLNSGEFASVKFIVKFKASYRYLKVRVWFLAHEDSLNLAIKVLLVGNRLMPCEFTNLAKLP